MQLVTDDCTYLFPTSGNCVRKQEQEQSLILRLPLTRCGPGTRCFFFFFIASNGKSKVWCMWVLKSLSKQKGIWNHFFFHKKALSAVHTTWGSAALTVKPELPCFSSCLRSPSTDTMPSPFDCSRSSLSRWQPAILHLSLSLLLSHESRCWTGKSGSCMWAWPEEGSRVRAGKGATVEPLRF